MTVCPVALAVGCKRCIVVKVCPLKGVLGDYEKEAPVPAAAEPAAAEPAAEEPAAEKPAAEKP